MALMLKRKYTFAQKKRFFHFGNPGTFPSMLSKRARDIVAATEPRTQTTNTLTQEQHRQPKELRRVFE